MELFVISAPAYFKGEASLINFLFESGMSVFHLRKEGVDRLAYARLIAEIDGRYHDRIALHQFHELILDFPSVKRLHYPERLRKEQDLAPYAEGLVLSTSIHQLDNLQILKGFDYVLYGPVFNSLSKKGHKGITDADFVLPERVPGSAKVIALGGVDVTKVDALKNMGFDGLAVLGTIWNDHLKAIATFKSLADKVKSKHLLNGVAHAVKPKTRPYVMSIAGFDPSAGAGVLADVKCFEQLEVYGIAVCAALTVQTDTHFLKNEWLSAEQIIEQFAPLLSKFKVAACKIGLIKNTRVLLEVVSYLRSHRPEIKIVLDPVLKASAGYEFHDWKDGLNKLEPILKQIDLITPNYPEMLSLGGKNTVEASAKIWAAYCPVLLKGGHLKVATGTDYLFTGKETHELKPVMRNLHPKHGSGCVLSAAITAQLAKGDDLLTACTGAKKYVEKFLSSNPSLLGYHKL
jgi:hydroxymethylpyrimidine/phosphomethylpyrimidine kinase